MVSGFNIKTVIDVNSRTAIPVDSMSPMAKLPESDFWRRLVEAWEPRGLPTSQTGVAEALGVYQSAVQQWVRGTSLPKLDRCVDIAERGRVCVEWLITGRGPKFPDSARGDVWLEQVCKVLRDFPESQRSSVLDYLQWQAERVGSGIQAQKPLPGIARKLT